MPCQISHAKNPHHARVTAPKTRRAVKVNKRAQGSFGYLIRPPPAMYPALRSLPSCAPINRDHAREHERKSEFRFEVGNETRNPRRRGPVPIKCCGVACAQIAKKPNHKPGYVNSPADTFRFCHLPCPGLLPPSPPAEAHKRFDCVPMATLRFGLHDCIRPCLRRSYNEHRFCSTTPSIADFWTNRGRRARSCRYVRCAAHLAPRCIDTST